MGAKHKHESDASCKYQFITELEQTYGPLPLTPSEGENITYRRRVADYKDPDNDKIAKQNDKQIIHNLALVIKNNSQLCIMSDKQAFEQFKISGHSINLDHKLTNLDEYSFNKGFPKAIKIALENYKIVDSEALFNDLNNAINRKLRFITVFQSFVVEMNYEKRFIKLKWMYGDDDLVDEFLMAFDRVSVR